MQKYTHKYHKYTQGFMKSLIANQNEKLFCENCGEVYLNTYLKQSNGHWLRRPIEKVGCVELLITQWLHYQINDVLHEMFGINNALSQLSERFLIDHCLMRKDDLLVLSAYDIKNNADIVVIKIGTDEQLIREKDMLTQMDLIDSKNQNDSNDSNDSNDKHETSRLKLIDYGLLQPTNVHYLVETPKGIPLKDLTSSGMLTPEKIEEISFKLADHLKFLHHTYNFFHGDIKPSNIIILDQCHVILIDFGVSIILDNSTRLYSFGCTEKYANNKQRNLSPDIDHSDDIFSLCATVYALEMGVKSYEEKYDVAPELNVLLESKLVKKIYDYMGEIRHSSLDNPMGSPLILK